MPYPCYCPGSPACDDPFTWCDRTPTEELLPVTTPTPDAHEDAVLGGPAPRYPDPDPNGWPFRHVAMSCDHPAGCDADLDCGDIRADTLAQAMPAAVGYARAQGWGVTDDGRIAHCPDHTGPAEETAVLLGVPAEVPGD